MSTSTKIEWADHTFNPWIGCTKVSPGCDHCYAEAWDRRFAVSGAAMHWGAGKTRTRTSAANWRLPLRWNERTRISFDAWAVMRRLGYEDAWLIAHGHVPPRRPRVFCASLADVFDNEVPVEWRRNLFDLIKNTPNLDWLLLTKRIGNAATMIEEAISELDIGYDPDYAMWPWPNVWIGATVVNQDEADRDIPKLLATPAAKRFLSIEPMLGPIDLRLPTRVWVGSSGRRGCSHCCNGDRCDDPTHFDRRHCPYCRGTGEATPFDWVIVGGESGPRARAMHPDWVRSLRDQCVGAGVPFHFKQWGEHAYEYDRDRDDPDYRQCDRMARLPGRWINLAGGHGFNGERGHYAQRVGKKAAGRSLDGRTWDETPTEGEG